MPNNYTTIIAKLKSMLEALQDGATGALFGEVHDYADGDFENYPAANIFELAGGGDVIDTHRNERTFTFRIMLYQEQSAAGKTKAEAAAKMRECVDKVIQMFDENTNLDGVVARVRVVPVALSFSARTGTFNFATLDVECVDLVNTYPNP